MAGHIKLDRKILNWEWYNDYKMVHLFIHLLLKANWQNNTWQNIIIQRGQLLTGVLSLSQSTGLSVSQTRSCLNRLQTTGEIAIKTTNKFSVITICKYDVYQSEKNQNSKQDSKQNDTQDDKQNSKQTDNTIRIEEDKKINNISIPIENFIFWESEKKSFLNAGDWIFKFCTDKNIPLEDFDNDAKIFISDIELKEDFKDAKELKRHFTNWYNLKHKKNGHKHVNGFHTEEKLGTSAARIKTAKEW